MLTFTAPVDVHQLEFDLNADLGPGLQRALMVSLPNPGKLAYRNEEMYSSSIFQI